MTEIIRSLAINGNFCPSAVNVLGEIPKEALFNIPQGLRHPDAIYRLSLEKLKDAFCKVADGYLEKMEEYRSDASKKLELGQLIKDQHDFLHILQEHLDEMWLILKTLIDPASAKNGPIFADRYVLENKLPGARSFQSAIADYKKTLRIANKLKHQQTYLRGVAIWQPNSVHLGYYLEEPGLDGVIGPSLEIHPDQGAFSFARDLKIHLLNVYLCSEKLVNAIKKALDSRGMPLRENNSSGVRDWEKVVLRASKIPAAYFPKEAKKSTASFEINDEEQVLTIKCPEHVQVTFVSPIKAAFSTVGDGYSRSFKVPLP